MIFVQYVLPYIVALITAICSGLISYFLAIKKCKLDNEVKIKEIQEQHKLDLENQKELFKLEIEKINLQHQNEIERMKVDSNNQLTNNFANSFFTTMLSNPNSLESLLDLANKFKK
ncbi:MAG: hypothetical protein K2P14_04075 [Anaeroplasmataceae bacterium]|nr:hypothetical protein [Anaeroplasmataceae bacterium]